MDYVGRDARMKADESRRKPEEKVGVKSDARSLHKAKG